MITPDCYPWRPNKRLIETEKYCPNKRQCLLKLEPSIIFDKIAGDYQKHLAEFPRLFALSKFQVLAACSLKGFVVDQLDDSTMKIIIESLNRSSVFQKKFDQVFEQLSIQDQNKFTRRWLRIVQSQV